MPLVKEWCEVDKTQTMTQLIPEMNNYFPSTTDSLNIVSVNDKIKALKMPKIRNLLITGKAYKKATADTFASAKIRAKKLIERIDKVLKN